MSEKAFHFRQDRAPIGAQASETTGQALERLIVFTVRQLGTVKLSELLPAFWAIAPGLAPETIHDHLNNLLAEGKLRLSPAGAYYTP